MFQKSFLTALLVMLLLPRVPEAAQRTFVSAGSGNDSNPCSRQLPCRNFQAALLQTDPNGEIVVLDSGGYGTVVIDKSVALIAPAGVHAAITAFSGTAINTISGGATVTVRNIHLNALGGSDAILMGVTGTLFVDQSTVIGFSTGISCNTEANIFVSDSTFRQMVGRAIHVQNTGSGVSLLQVNHCEFEQNGQGVAMFAHANGVVRDSLFADHSNWGVLVNDSGAGPTELVIENCSFLRNSTGILTIASTSHVDVSNSTIVLNTTGISITGGTINSRGNNTLRRNGTNGTFSATFLPN